MKLKSLFISLTIAITHQATAQVHDWTKQIGGLGYTDNCSEMTKDTAGNIYITGFFEGTADFDPSLINTYNLTSHGYVDAFVQKLDANGAFIWAKQMGAKNDDRGNGIAVDKLGNVYVTGMFEDTVDFDPSANTLNLISKGVLDVFIQKLDPNGNLLWVKQMGSKGGDRGNSITVDATGNIYTTGSFTDTLDIDPSANTVELISKGYDVFIQKLDTDGNFVWGKQTTAPTNATANTGESIKVDDYGNSYIAGSFQGTTDFDPSSNVLNLIAPGTGYYDDAFILKLTADGDLDWVKQMGSIEHDKITALTLDAASNIYTTGYFSTTVDFNPSADTVALTSNGKFDIFVQKLDASGNFIWAKNVGGKLYDGSYGITTDSLGNVYTTGNFQDTTDFDPSSAIANMISKGGADIFVHKLDANGNFVWAQQMSCNDPSIYNTGISIVSDATGDNLYVAGHFRDTVDFDPGVNLYNYFSKGGYDIFLQKLSTTPNPLALAAKHAKAISVYPNPTNGLVSISLGEKYQNTKVEIKDLTGRLIYVSNAAQTNILTVNLNDNAAGLYIVSVSTNDTKQSFKLIKE